MSGRAPIRPRLRRSPSERSWQRLDNASKIFTATANTRDTKVYRIFAELDAAIDPPALQRAVERSLERFPGFRVVIRRGVFWYYIEESDLEPEVVADEQPLFAPLYIRGRRMLNFRVVYHGCRIALEVFHSLSDGTGALWFLQSIVAYYLAARDPALEEEASGLVAAGSSRQGNMDDGFSRWFRGRPRSKREDAALLKPTNAWRVRALKPSEPPSLDGRTTLVEVVLPVSEVLAAARAAETSVTVWLIAQLVAAIYERHTPQRRARPVIVSVPVNLRRFYPSMSARNFFWAMKLRHDRLDLDAVPSLEALIAELNPQLTRQLTRENLDIEVARLVAIERKLPIRILPTTIKDWALRLRHRLEDRAETTAFSNVGVVQMPPGMSRHIRAFGTATVVRRFQICATSFGERLTLCLTSPSRDSEISRLFCRRLVAAGLNLEVTGNDEVLDPADYAIAEAEPEREETKPEGES